LPTGEIPDLRTIEGPAVLLDDDALEPEESPDFPIRVLVVDDHPDVRDLVGNLLERCGARVVTAEDGVRAMALAKEAHRSGDPFGVVVLDMQLPGLDGFGVAEQLRQVGFAGAIIGLSASAMRQDRDRGLAAGCDDYLAKPIRRSELVNLLRRHANGRDERPSENGTRRVLIVEDDDDARSALAGLLERRTDDEIRAVGSGSEALEVAREWIPTVVLLDLSLPDMDGLELARSLRKEEALADTKLIALTGRTEEGTEEEVRRAGCGALLRKPVQDVAEIIRSYSAAIVGRGA
jgi:CheY-like chemotaxis protein